jgi:hypothetical protein
MHRTLERVRAEFTEMPGLRLTTAQVVRLCSVERTVCQAVLDALVAAKFLRVAADGRYLLAGDDVSRRSRPARAEHVTVRAHASRKHA